MSSKLIGVSDNHVLNILRSAGTKRWTIVPMTRQQTLAEHHGLVASLALELAKAALDPEVGHVGRNAFLLEVVSFALDHDLQEVVTGDLPTPGKTALGLVANAHFKDAEDAIRVQMGLPVVPTCTLTTHVLRAADNLEAIWYAGTHLCDGVGLEALRDICIRTASAARVWPPRLREAVRGVLETVLQLVINDQAEAAIVALCVSLED